MRSKIAGGEPVITKAPERGNVINLMDALKRSIEEERRPPAPSMAKAAAPAKEKPAAADKAAPAKAPVKKAAKTAAKAPAKTPAKRKASGS